MILLRVELPGRAKAASKRQQAGVWGNRGDRARRELLAERQTGPSAGPGGTVGGAEGLIIGLASKLPPVYSDCLNFSSSGVFEAEFLGTSLGIGSIFGNHKTHSLEAGDPAPIWGPPGLTGSDAPGLKESVWLRTL